MKTLHPPTRLLERPAEHEFEPAHGLPEILPANERLLWQGAPDAWRLTRDALHLKAIGAYFGVLLAWRGATVLANGGSASDAAVAVLWLLPVALAGLALIGTLGWLIARTSVYTVTDRRVVMRIGIVLSVTFNLPYRQIESAGVKTRADGSGDLTLLLDASSHIAYLHLWPHARPWEVRRSQPMLRGLADVGSVAALVAGALKSSLEGSTPARRVTAVRLPQAVGERGDALAAAASPARLPEHVVGMPVTAPRLRTSEATAQQQAPAPVQTPPHLRPGIQPLAA